MTTDQFGGAPHTKPGHQETDAATGDGAVNSKERAPTNWIPVAQELPPEGEIVLTYVDGLDGYPWCARYLKHLGGRWLSTHDEPPTYTPTHWARDFYDPVDAIRFERL